MPWSVIVMMSGVTVLISLMEKTGGLDLFTAALAALATPGTITGVIAFVIGLISVYSSTSGVVLPAFLPDDPGADYAAGRGGPGVDCDVHERRCASGRSVAALDDRRALPRGRLVGGERAECLQQAPRLGTVDDGGRSDHLLLVFLNESRSVGSAFRLDQSG